MPSAGQDIAAILPVRRWKSRSLGASSELTTALLDSLKFLIIEPAPEMKSQRMKLSSEIVYVKKPFFLPPLNELMRFVALAAIWLEEGMLLLLLPGP